MTTQRRSATGQKAATSDAAPGRVIGRSRPRPDSEPKVRGRTRFGADRIVPGVVHGRLVLSPYAHSRIEAIDTSAALMLPGTIAVLTAADLPIASTSRDRLAEPLARSEVIFAGQPVALAVGVTPEAAADAAEAVHVSYDPLPVMTDPRAAMAEAAPLVRDDRREEEEGATTPAMGTAQHAAVGGGGEEDEIAAERWSENVTGRQLYRNGDPAAAIAQAAARVTTAIRSSWLHQSHLEPQVATAWVDENGGLVVEASAQGTFSLRTDVSGALGWPQHRVRVVGTPLGGAFGAKWGLFEPLVAATAIKLGRPVRLELERGEELRSTNPSQAFQIDLQIGASADGRFEALEVLVVADAGAYEDFSVEELVSVLVGGPYAWPANEIRAYGVRTNRFGTGPYRGPGAPQSAFAIETAVDELAGQLGMDPLELRRRNAAVPGSAMFDDEPWPEIGLPQVLDVLAGDPLWQRRGSLPKSEGVGVAIGWWPGAKDAAAAVCRVSNDGTVQVITGVADMSGVSGGFAAIAAEILGVEPEQVEHVSVDTASAPPSPGSGGSTITYSVGRAIRAAAEDARSQLLRAAARQLEISEGDLELVGGAVQPIGTPDRAIPIAQLLRANSRAGGAPIEGHGATERPSLAPQVAGALAHVRVDVETGEVELLDFHLAQDVGRALNPALVTGQMLGGAVQSVGIGLMEGLVHDSNGQVMTGSFLDYALPRATDVPSLRATIVEVPSPDGVFGAKGIGESPAVPGAAAIANAIAAATGVRLRELPMTPARVWAALQR
jgi:CO/xanthine dehydrogenase Mo-binding subunit